MPTTSDELTPAMVKRYVDSAGAHCPYCGSDEIEAGPVEADGGSAKGDVECASCGRQWRDVFLLGAVDVLDDHGRYKDTIDPEEDDADKAVPQIEALFAAADAHADAAGEGDHEIGDLQEMLRAAWRVITPAQRTSMFEQPELIALAELPEYKPLIGRLVDPS